jgi:HK97 family phage portal protein
MLGYTSGDTISISEHTAMNLSAVYRAVSLVSGSIASLPLRTLEESGDGQKDRVASFLDFPGGRDKRFTAFEWKELLMVQLLLHGNVYLQHIYNGAGAIVALIPINPHCVAVYWDETQPGGKRFDASIKTASGGTEKMEFNLDTMTQIMGISFDGLKGISCIAHARMSFGTALAGDQAANRQFTNGAMVSGMVTPEADEDFTGDEAKTIKESVNTNMTGVENAGGIAVMNKKLKFQAWQLSAADAQFLESRTFQIDEIGRWFGVPPHLLGLTEKSTSWGAGIAEQNRGLARYTLTGWTSRIDERLSLLLASPARTAEFDYSGFIKPSPEDEINLLIAQVNMGLLTLNEARKIRNMPALDGGDIPRFPAGSVPPVDPNAAPAPEGAPA